MIKRLKFILTNKEKVYLFYILFLVISGSVLELLAVAIFSPYIEILTGAQSDNSYMNRIIDSFLDGRDIGYRVVVVSALIIFIYVVKNLFLSYEKNTIYKYSYSVQHRVAKELLSSYMEMPYTFHLKTNPAELIRTIRSDAGNFAMVVIHVIELMMELLVCMVLGIYLIIVSPIISGIIVSMLAVVTLAYIKLAKNKLHELGKQNQQYEATVYRDINQALGGIKEIKVLERNDFFLDEFSGALFKNLKILRISRLMSILPKYCIESLCIVGLMIAVIVMIQINGDNVGSFIPQIAVFVTAAFRLMPSVGRINEHTSSIDATMPSVELIYNDLKRVIDNKIDVIRSEKDVTFKQFDAVRLNNVEYKYPDAEKSVFVGVNIDIPRGKTVAFVGESGAGKTTLADCILGILKPISGKISVGNMDIFDNLLLWHKNIGYIPQFIYLSDDSIMNNIAFGIKPEDINEEKVIEAAKKAKLYDFVCTLPDGFETVVGERGARLSGGQRQRIGIARALYHDPEILVLDEATSALDNETETAVMESIDGLHGMKTMIIIAHRLSTIENADLVFEVKDGQVIEKSKKEVLGK